MLDKVLPHDAILCGHSFNNDLDSLRLYHPYIVDIGRLFNLSGSGQHPTSLRNLYWKFCREEIQNSRLGHCSVQDSYATMRLAKMKFQEGKKY